MQLSFTSAALRDIDDISDWYEYQRQGLSYDFELCLEVAVNQILRSPLAFQKKYRNVSVIYLHRFPYGVHFVITADTIIIVGIFHTSRSPRRWRNRQ